MNERYIRFNPNIAKQKPSNKDKCPFCDKSQLGKNPRRERRYDLGRK